MFKLQVKFHSTKNTLCYMLYSTQVFFLYPTIFAARVAIIYICNYFLKEDFCHDGVAGIMIFMFTGITDDDLRETAYEVLLACAGASGYAVCHGLGFITNCSSCSLSAIAHYCH